jgi:hypothetical protein
MQEDIKIRNKITMIVKIKTFSGETLYLPEEDYLEEVMYSDLEEREFAKTKYGKAVADEFFQKIGTRQSKRKAREVSRAKMNQILGNVTKEGKQIAPKKRYEEVLDSVIKNDAKPHYGPETLGSGQRWRTDGDAEIWANRVWARRKR